VSIADRHDFAIGGEAFDVAEAFGERGLRRSDEVLAREDQHCMFEKGSPDRGPFRRGERVEVDTGDDGADGGGRGFDSRVHGRVPKSCARRSL
jgi:hypothetical protein